MENNLQTIGEKLLITQGKINRYLSNYTANLISFSRTIAAVRRVYGELFTVYDVIAFNYNLSQAIVNKQHNYIKQLFNLNNQYRYIKHNQEAVA